MKTLSIRWQRLVDGQGQTCPRCAATGDSVAVAVARLRDALRPLDIAVIADLRPLTQAQFDAAPLESNRVWINDRPLEEWVGATAGSSRCCSSCGDADCRTVEVGGATLEALPVPLILKAGLLAAADLVTFAEDDGRTER
jgi:hypothetical protein